MRMRSLRAACSCAGGDLPFLAHPLQHDEAARAARRRNASTASTTPGARMMPAMSAASASVSCDAGFRSIFCDIVSMP